MRAINDEEDYKKCRNYWKYLKGKFAKDGIQLVSVTNNFKFQAPDGKQRAADALDAEWDNPEVIQLFQHKFSKYLSSFLGNIVIML